MMFENWICCWIEICEVKSGAIFIEIILLTEVFAHVALLLRFLD
jgi:hypothetical protein